MVPPADEMHLVRAAQEGDVVAFEELVRRHRTLVYRVALRLLRNPTEAEDAAQDAFIQAWQALPGFQGASSLLTWLYRIVTNRCLRLLHGRQMSEALRGDREDTRTPEQLAEVKAELEAVIGAIASLAPSQRAALVLRELEGLPYEDIARVLGITVPAVKGRIHRARLELVEAMRGQR